MVPVSSSDQTCQDEFEIQALKFRQTGAGRVWSQTLAKMAAFGGDTGEEPLVFLMGNALSPDLSSANLIQLFINHIRLGFWSLAESVLPQLATTERRGCLALLNTLIETPAAVDW